MNREQALEKLKEIQKVGDREGAHLEADDVLCKLLVFLGYEDVVKEFEKVNKWYS